MGFRFQKRIKVAPGVKLNVGKRGISTSVGSKGLRVNASSKGFSVGSSIPGTEVSYNTKLGSRDKRPQRTNYERVRQQQLKDIEKENALQKAKFEVEIYESHLAMLTSVHEEVSNPIDWNKMATSNQPFNESEDGPHVKEIKEQLDSYKPTWRDILFKRIEARKREWEKSIPKEAEKDHELIQQWYKSKSRANSILNKDVNSWGEVINEIDPFEDIKELGSDLTYSINNNGDKAFVKLHIRNKQAIPEKTLSLTKTGKLSTRNMAKGKYFQLYQDYVVSCVFRIAREFIILLPLNLIQVDVYDESPAEETEDYGCILSVQMNREEIEATNFQNIDCSDTLESYNYNMKFLKTKGFKYVKEVD